MANLNFLLNGWLWGFISFLFLLTDIIITASIFSVSPIPLTETNPFGFTIWAVSFAIILRVGWVLGSYFSKAYVKQTNIELLPYVDGFFITIFGLFIIQSSFAIMNNLLVLQWLFDNFPGIGWSAIRLHIQL